MNRKSNFRSGNVVLRVSGVLLRGRWLIAVIENTEQPDDGLVRTAPEHNVEGFAKRNIRKLGLIEEIRDTSGISSTANYPLRVCQVRKDH